MWFCSYNEQIVRIKWINIKQQKLYLTVAEYHKSEYRD